MDECEGGEGVRDVPAGDVTRNDVDIVENVGEVTLALIGTEQVCCTPPIKTKIFDYFFFQKTNDHFFIRNSCERCTRNGKLRSKSVLR